MGLAMGRPFEPASASGFRPSTAYRRRALLAAILSTLALFSIILFASLVKQAVLQQGSTLFTLELSDPIGVGSTEPGDRSRTAGGASGTPADAAPAADTPPAAPRRAATETPTPHVPEAPFTLNFQAPPVTSTVLEPITQLTAPTVSLVDDGGLSADDGAQRTAGGGAGAGTGAGAGNGTGTGTGDGNGDGAGGKPGRVLYASWAPTMDHSKNYRLYPPKARDAGIEGEAWLKCFVIRRDRVRDCRLLGEAPQGHGFGQAALRGAPSMRIRVQDQAGRRVYDEWVIVTKTFTIIDLQQAPSRQADRRSQAASPTP